MSPTDPSDHLSRTAQSSCCQTPVYSGSLCSECGEHCEVEWPDEDGPAEPDYDAPRPLTAGKLPVLPCN